MDDILGEESDNESDGRGKDKTIAEEEQQQQREPLQQLQPEVVHLSRVGLGPPAPVPEEKIQTLSAEDSSSSCLPR